MLCRMIQAKQEHLLLMEFMLVPIRRLIPYIIIVFNSTTVLQFILLQMSITALFIIIALGAVEMVFL